MTLSGLAELRHISGVKPCHDTLVDIREVRINGTTAEERLESFMNQVGNPYCFRVADTPVRISFCPNERSIDDKLKEHFLSLKRNS